MSATVDRSTSATPNPPVGTARRASGLRRFAVWGAIVIFALVVGIAGALVSGVGDWTERDRLDPESVGPGGTAALVAILRDQGVDVSVARDRDEALRLLEQRPATLVMPDSPLLQDGALRELFDGAGDVVLIDPRSRGVEMLFPGASAGAVAPAGAVASACDIPAADRAGPVVPGRLFDPGPSGATGCYPVDDQFGLLVDAGGDRVVSAIDGNELVTNERLADDGNAALALNLMGRLPHLVWYVPSLTDSDVASDPTLGELTPGWVTPAIVLLAVAVVTAGIWRGRRFGPLVVERLPVTARATETMEGRGRLYERGRDAVHAADSLRLGALERMRRMLALPPAASAAQIAEAAAELTGTPPAKVRGALFEREPRTEAELLAVSDDLREIEDAVARGIRGDVGTDVHGGASGDVPRATRRTDRTDEASERGVDG